MDCIKSQNQCVNTIVFPGSLAPSSYTCETFLQSYNLRLVYIPFKSKSCHCSYFNSAPIYIPALLAINNANRTNLFCIHFHGNACDIGQIALCAQRESQSYNAHYMIVDYPGFGLSEGFPNETVVNEMAIAVHEFVVHSLNIPFQHILIIGRSIGTGPACMLASHLELMNQPPFALVLHSPFTSICDATSDLLGGASYLMFDRWKNWTKLIGEGKEIIKAPVLFLHADNDKVISCQHSILMHEFRTKYQLPSELFIQKSTEKVIKGHNFFDYERDVVLPVKRFLTQLQQPINKLPNAPNKPILPTLILLGTKVEPFSKIPEFYMKEHKALLNEMNRYQSNHKRHCWNCWNIDPNSCIGWACCPCTFCLEGCLACPYHSCRIFSSSLLQQQPIFDYQSLRKKELTVNGSIYHLFFRKQELAQKLNEDVPIKTRIPSRTNSTESTVTNPLAQYQNEDSKSSKSQTYSQAIPISKKGIRSSRSEDMLVLSDNPQLAKSPTSTDKKQIAQKELEGENRYTNGVTIINPPINPKIPIGSQSDKTFLDEPLLAHPIDVNEVETNFIDQDETEHLDYIPG